MNIFYLSHDVDECARFHVDKHVVKMILESAQLLSTAHRVLDGVESTVNVNDGTKFLELFEKSIRPIVVNKVTLTSRAGNVKVTLDAKTFYQPEKKMNITEETVSR